MLNYLLKEILNLPHINLLIADRCNHSSIDGIEDFINSYVNLTTACLESSGLYDKLNPGQPTAGVHEPGTRYHLAGYNLGLWVWDVIKDQVYFGPEFYRVLGYKPGEFQSSIKSLFDMLNPDDREYAFNKLLEAIYKRKKYFSVQYSIKTKQGRWKRIFCKARIFDNQSASNSLFLVGLHAEARHENKGRNEDLVHELF